MLASKRNPIFCTYTDEDIQRMYEATDQMRKALILKYDQGKATDQQLDDIEHRLFRLDDELCARGY